MPFKYLSKHLNEIKESQKITYSFEDFDLDESQKDELIKMCSSKQSYIKEKRY